MPRVAFLGPAGTFTDAALQRFADDLADGLLAGGVEAVPADTNPAALRMVRDGDVDFACVPIENSVEGAVTPTYDCLAVGSRLQIFAETGLDIAFSVLVRPGTRPEDVRELRSHPVGLAQVREWVEANLPGVRMQTASSNAAAALDVAEGRTDAAAAPARAGVLYGLESLADGVADVGGARTRFVLVGRPAVPPPRTGRDRTSVVIDLPNEPGSLLQAIMEFGVRQIDMTRIESRPTRRALGTYRFHIDCVGHIDDAIIAEALRALYRRCSEVRFLGSWPRSSPGGAPPPESGAAERWLAAIREGGPE